MFTDKSNEDECKLDRVARTWWGENYDQKLTGEGRLHFDYNVRGLEITTGVSSINLDFDLFLRFLNSMLI